MKKKIPMRKCIGCQELKSKKEMLRIVRTGETEFVLDKTGKQNGRGAYVCRRRECLEQAIRNKGLERSFQMKIPETVYETLAKEMDTIDTK